MHQRIYLQGSFKCTPVTCQQAISQLVSKNLVKYLWIIILLTNISNIFSSNYIRKGDWYFRFRCIYDVCILKLTITFPGMEGVRVKVDVRTAWYTALLNDCMCSEVILMKKQKHYLKNFMCSCLCKGVMNNYLLYPAWQALQRSEDMTIILWHTLGFLPLLHDAARSSNPKQKSIHT